jgi:hypothetical protein
VGVPTLNSTDDGVSCTRPAGIIQRDKQSPGQPCALPGGSVLCSVHVLSRGTPAHGKHVGEAHCNFTPSGGLIALLC